MHAEVTTTVEARDTLGALQRLFAEGQVGAKVFDLMLLLNQSLDFCVTRDESGVFRCSYTVYNMWEMFDPGRQIAFEVLPDPVAFRLDTGGMPEATVLCSAIGKRMNAQEEFSLKGSVILENDQLSVVGHEVFKGAHMVLPDSVRVRALNEINNSEPASFGLSKQCSVTVNRGKPGGQASFSVLFEPAAGVYCNALVMSSGEVVPESEYSGDIVDWMILHLDNSLVSALGVRQIGRPAADWPFDED